MPPSLARCRDMALTSPPRTDAAGKMSRACREIASALLEMDGSGAGHDPGRVRRVIFDACSRHGLPRVPKNREILSAAASCMPGGGPEHGACDNSSNSNSSSNSGGHLSRLQDDPGLAALGRMLLKKPAKTASGVAVVAVMPKPFACPHGRCTYCPGGPEYGTPNSYTGAEPPALDAIRYEHDPVPQIRTKLEKLEAFGHDTSKTEIVIVGGTFLFMPRQYREAFVKSCYDALNGAASDSLAQAQLLNETSRVRCVGLTVETKPDYCMEEHIDSMLGYGATRVEIGVQSLRDNVYRITNRGHTYADVTRSFQLAKDAGYKIAAHMMPGLPTMTPDMDIEDFARLYDDPDLRPDMLKIYPSLVIRGTPLYEEYRNGRYEPYSDQEMLRVLAEAKKRIPKWVRIMRVQREIPPSQIVAGPRQGNLRQLVRQRLEEQGTPCRCIRCREAGLSRRRNACYDRNDGRDGAHGRAGNGNNIGSSSNNNGSDAGQSAHAGPDALRLDVVHYDSSGGNEAFISYEDDAERIYGFVRLRSPGPGAHRPEVSAGTCLIRELHVYGRMVGLGAPPPTAPTLGAAIQHSGLGRALVENAENVARERFGARRLLVISAIGTREYYRKLGYSLYGPYMARDL